MVHGLALWAHKKPRKPIVPLPSPCLFTASTDRIDLLSSKVAFPLKMTAATKYCISTSPASPVAEDDDNGDGLDKSSTQGEIEPLTSSSNEYS